MEAPDGITLRHNGGRARGRDGRDRVSQTESTAANRAGVVFFWTVSVTLVFTSLFVYLPQLETARGMPYAKALALKALVWVIFAELVINWGLCSMKDLSRVTVRRIQRSVANAQLAAADDGFPFVPMEDMAPCPACQVPVPPRARHCKLCSMCILKRDHHCYFTASCIGFSNQRYFVVLTFYVAAGAFYGALLIWGYAEGVLPHDSWFHYGRYIPVVALFQWFADDLALEHLLLSLQLSTCIFAFGTALRYFLREVRAILREQTAYEASKDIRLYHTNSSTGTKFREVFGSYWLLNFLLPLPTLPLGVDGIQWKTFKQLKSQ